MKEDILKYYKLIGEVNATLSKAGTYDEAVKKTIRFYIDKIPCRLAVLWGIDETGGVLNPVYWIGNEDLTGKRNKADDGIVGKCFSNQISIMDKEKNVIVVPFSSDSEKYGCVQLVGADDHILTEEEGDLAELLAVLITSKIDEEALVPYAWPYNEILISAENIEKTFVNGDIETRVLKGISMNVYKGEFLVILGESGCGKSTLLNIIGGMDRATSGEFSFRGKKLQSASEDEMTDYRRDNIGFIFQNYNLMPNLTAVQNIDIIGELVNDPMDAGEVLDLVGLSDRKDKYPSQLSGGQQQRVSIARSLVKKPSLILADEPTAALDYATSIGVLKVIEKIVSGGTTMVMVTHNEEITKMADRVVRLRDGRLYETTINKHPVKAEELVW